MKRAILLIGMLLIFAILLSGCVEQLDGFSKGLNETLFPKEKAPAQEDTNKTKEPEKPKAEITPNKTVYLYCFGMDTVCNNRLSEFLSYSKEKAYCVFETLESEQIANMLINLQEKDVKVKVRLGKEDSMINCDTACIPSSKSQFNNLFKNAVDVAAFSTTENWCINDYGIWIGSSGLEKNSSTFSNAIIFYNTELASLYEARFKEVYG